MNFFLQSASTSLRRKLLSTIHHSFAPGTIVLAIGALFAAASLCPAAAATTFAYTGGGSGSATTPVSGNFSSGFSPGVVSSTTSDTLSFAGSTYTATDDLTQQILANMLTFTNTGAVTLARGGAGANNSISLGGTNPSINVNGTGNALINIDLVLTANTTFGGTKPGNQSTIGQLTIAGVISGTGGISLGNSNNNVITLSGNNSFTGAIAANANTLKLGNANALGNSSAVTVGSSGTLDLNGQTIGAGTNIASIAGTLTNSSTTDATFNGKVNGTSSFSMSGTGNVILNGPINLTGFGSSLQMSGSGKLTLSGSDDNSATGLIISSGTVVLSKASTAAVHAVGSNGFTISGGTVQLAGTGNDQIPDNEAISLDNSTLDLNGRSETIGYVYSSGSSGVITNSAGGSISTLTVGGQNVNPGSNSYGGKISDGVGTVSIIKTGTGAITFSGTSSYTGGTTVTGGTLNAKAANSLGMGALAVNNMNTGAGTTGTNVVVNFSANQTVSSLSSTVAPPASGTNTAQVTIASNATLTDSQSGTTNYAGSVSGGTLSIAGKSSANSAIVNYTGTDSAAQTNVGAYANLQLNNSGGSALTGPVAVATNGTLTLSPNATNNEIATTAPPSTPPSTAAVTLNGGTLNANGSDGAVSTPVSLATATVTSSMGALALGANGTSANPSVLAFAAGTASQPFVLAFADSTKTLVMGSGYLNITGYTGTTNALYIGTTADLSPAQLALLSFNGLKAGQLTNGEIVALAAAPEPSGWLTLLVGAAALGGLAQARRRKESRRAVAA